METRDLLFGAIGDDLTGAVDLASELVAAGVETDLRVGVPEGGSSEAVSAVVALKSRTAPAQRASQDVLMAAKWLSMRAPRQLFFKYSGAFDSTPLGNIGCCTDVLRDLIKTDRVIFCPSHPINARTVYNGYLFFGNVLVSDSPKRYDPLTPMVEPDLVKVLAAQTALGVGSLPWNVIAQGPAAMQSHVERLVSTGKPYIIADAISEDDLAKIADLTADWPLVTGNARIAAEYARIWRERGWIAGARPPERLGRLTGAGAILAGSCADQTLEQLSLFEAEGGAVLFIDPLAAAAGEDVVSSALDWARARIGEREVAIATSARPEEVSRAQAQLGRHGAAELAESLLARIARGLIGMGVGRLVVAGGETSGAVVDALGVRRLKVGPQKAGSVPLAEADIGRPLGLCLKSGKLGARDVFVERLRALEAGRC